MSHRNKASSSAKPIKCKRCGKCCIVWDGASWVDCKWLIRYLPLRGADVCGCVIYKHRVYSIIGKSQYCNLRSRVPYDFPECPFNAGKGLHPHYVKSGNK